MKTYLKLELKRSILSIRTFISILILIIPCIIFALKEGVGIYSEFDGLDTFLYMYNVSDSAFIVPIVSVIYAVTVFYDKQSGFSKKLLEIIDIKTYIKGKLIVNSIVNTFIITISYGVFALFFIVLFGIRNTEAGGIGGGAYIVRCFSGIFYSHKLVYFLLVSVMVILSAITFSSVVLVLTMIVNKVYVPYVFTIFFIVLTAIVLNAYGINTIIDFNIILQFWIVTNGKSAIELLLYDGVLVLLSYLLVHLYLKNYNHKNAFINLVKGKN